MKAAAGYFALIVAGALLAALLGGLFGALVATISPPFVTTLFDLAPEDGPAARYAFSVGMIWGVFIGAAVAGFACLLAVLMRIVRLRSDHTK